MEDVDTTLDSLIDVSTQWWKVERVRALVNPNIAAEILKIRVCPGSNDKLFWSQERNGIYTVRSVYKFFYLSKNKKVFINFSRIY